MRGRNRFAGKIQKKKRNGGKIDERFVLAQQIANPSCTGKKPFVSASGNYFLSGRHSQSTLWWMCKKCLAGLIGLQRTDNLLSSDG